MTAPAARPPAEELANVITHGLGIPVAVAATVGMGVLGWRGGDPLAVVSTTIYGLSLTSMFTSSVLYHSAHHPVWRERLLLFDYASIYLLIAGSYTPFALVSMRELGGGWLFGGMWAAAVAGIALRVWGPRDWLYVSTALYVAMGWGGALGGLPLLRVLPWGGLAWLVAGGVAYTVGAAFFLWERLPFNHLIWHLFVIAGAVCHLVAVWAYVL